MFLESVIKREWGGGSSVCGGGGGGDRDIFNTFNNED